MLKYSTFIFTVLLVGVIWGYFAQDSARAFAGRMIFDFLFASVIYLLIKVSVSKKSSR